MTTTAERSSPAAQCVDKREDAMRNDQGKERGGDREEEKASTLAHCRVRGRADWRRRWNCLKWLRSEKQRNGHMSLLFTFLAPEIT